MFRFFVLPVFLLSLSAQTLGFTGSSGDTSSTFTPWAIPRKETSPPFPDGLCGGELVKLPSSDLYSTDVKSNGGTTFLLPPRVISVWLPPGYRDCMENYPVLYCHDGQNAFLDENSWTGQSWRLTGALTRLYENGETSRLPIVVLIPSAQGDLVPGVRRRHLEYGDGNTPWSQAHLSFCARTLKPFIDSTFRTDASTKSTYAIGSSLGAQASLQLVLQYPEVFGGAACLSPAFGPSTLATVATHGYECLTGKKLFFDMGGDILENKVPWVDLWDHLKLDHQWNPGYWWLDTQLQPSLNALLSSLRSMNISHKHLTYPGARHNERAWSNRIHKPLVYFYGCDEERD